jgi:hypothetical protein
MDHALELDLTVARHIDRYNTETSQIILTATHLHNHIGNSEGRILPARFAPAVVVKSMVETLPC